MGKTTFFEGKGSILPLYKVVSLDYGEREPLYSAVKLMEVPSPPEIMGLILIKAPTLEQAIAQIEGAERTLKLKYQQYTRTGAIE